MAEIGKGDDPAQHLLQLVAGIAEERIRLLREVQNREMQTRSVNRQAARERLLWIAVMFRLLEFHVPALAPPNTRSDRSRKDVIEKTFERDLESFLRGLK